MVRLAILVGAVLAAGSAGAAEAPRISTEDVTRFYQVYEAADGRPGAEVLERDYLAPGTPLLHEFAKARRVTGERIAEAMAAHPQTYADARKCLAALPAVRRRLTTAFGKLAALYPEAKTAPVAIVVGRGRPVGMTSPAGVVMGLEALCAADFMDPDREARFVHTIAHEYGHIQQSAAQQALDPGVPGATVLTMSLMEGTAEFTAELISGGVGDYQHKAWTEGKEVEIGQAFLRDQDKTDLSAWMYNGVGDAAHPGDLGYWVGYRIVKAFYANARDKHAALKEIFEMPDPRGFVARSGWKPGM